ncbi:MAG: hypothetical protein MJZ08_06500 [Bacteroidaceae bacterium]|nr:hypothetical protein [Bacteroidaceae bacterium]
MKKTITSIIMGIALMAAASAQNAGIQFLHPNYDKVLEDGVHYAIQFDSLVIDKHDRRFVAPLSVNVGAVAVLELRHGQKIIVKGSNGIRDEYDLDKRRQGYPGILVPEGATLVVYGDGEIIAKGGDAGNGAIGGHGGDADMEGKTITFGYGGAGGVGGGGAAPGIGAVGGQGGLGGAQTELLTYNVSLGKEYNELTTNANKGENGKPGNNMGKVYVLGNVKISAQSGKQGTFVYNYATHGTGLNFTETRSTSKYFRIGYGGAGGNGGSGVAPLFDIGGSAPGSGGGGSGNSSSFMSSGDRDKLKFKSGAGGRGGNSLVDSISGMHGEGIGNYHFSEGNGGNAGKDYGGNGSLYIAGNVMLNCKYDANSVKAITDLSMVPEKARHLLVRPIVGAEWAGGITTLETFVGQEMPKTKVVIPVDVKKGSFMGYYDQYGKRVYDEQGNLALDKDTESYNFVVNTIDGADHWYVNSLDTVKLSASWSGVKSIFVVRYLENPNYNGYKTAKEHYTTGSVVVEQIYVPKTLSSAKVAVYPSGKNGIDRYLYNYKEGNIDSITVNLDKVNQTVVVEMLYDNKTYNLTWEGLDEETLSRRCINLSEYTVAGNYPHGMVINYPELRQLEGSQFDHWERKIAENKYGTFDGSEMPTEDLILRPVFVDVKFNASVEKEGDGSIQLRLKNGEVISDQTAIAYHSQVNIAITCATDYRCKSLQVIGVDTKREIELSANDSLTTFLMPDENVIVRASFEYHPYFTLKVSKNSNDAKYYVTKDWNTYFTNDNDYYKFDSKQFAGKVNDMKYGEGDRLYLHTDIVGDDGSREPKVSVSKKYYDETILQELKACSTGYADSTFTYFAVAVDKYMTAADLPIQIVWSKPRPQYNISAYDSDKASFTELYSGKYDISGTGVAYANDLITFSVESEDSTFDSSNILIEYMDGSDTQYMNVNKIEGKQTYLFRMPESDVELSLIDGNKHSIITDCENDSIIIVAPATGIAGYPVTFSLFYMSEPISDSKAADLAVLINGEPYTDVLKPNNNTFIMPDEDVNLSFLIGEITIVNFVREDMKPSMDVYNLMGQKVGNLRQYYSGTLPKGILIVNGKKIRIK